MSDGTRLGLPYSWESTTIGGVATVNPSGSTVTARDDQVVTFLPMAAVEELSGRIDLSDQRPFGQVKKGFTRFRDGDLLLAKITPSMENGKVAVAAGLCGGIGCGTTEFHVVRAGHGISPDFLRYFVLRSAFRREAKRNMQGAVGQQRVPADFIRGAELPLPPSAEQARIVARIDELFSRIDEGERALARAQKLLERYRQSVLKAAVTGELTREWRERQKASGGQSIESGEVLLQRILSARRAAWEKTELAKMQAKGVKPKDAAWKKKYREPMEIVTDYLGPLPTGWQRVRIDAGGEVQLGRQRSPAHHTGKHVRPYLRVANVFEERIDTGDVMCMNFTPEEFVTYALHRGDILLNEGQSRELVGRPAMYADEVPGACFTNTLVRFRATDAVLPAFAMLVFLHYMKSGDFQKIAKITTNIAHLGAGRFAEMAFPVPPVQEQREIVEVAEQRLNASGELADTVEVETRRSGALRQSVLRSAFSGQLVPQDTGDEPASALLARIAAERASTAAPPTRRVTR